MYTQTLDDTMAKAKKVERMTKATKFSNVFKTMVTDKSFQDEIAQKKLSQYVKNIEDASSKINIDDCSEEKVTDLIVEDPDIIPVKIEFNNIDTIGLPFFKSIQFKLNKYYSVKA